VSPLNGLVLGLLSLVAWTAAAQPPSERTLRARRVPLTGARVVVRVAPGIPTTLNFDADINPQQVAVGDPGRVTLLSVAPRSITLTPMVELDAPVTLRVRFADAALALEPNLELRADTSEVDAQVTLYWDARAPEGLLAQVAEWEARTAACEAELATLRERGRGTGPAALVLSGQLKKGVQADALRCPGTHAGHVACDSPRRYLAATWVVVTFRVVFPPGQPVWKAGRVWLVSEASRERFAARMVAVESEAQEHNGARTVAVEFARPPRHPGAGYRVEVQEADGARTLLLQGVTIDPEKSAPAENGP